MTRYIYIAGVYEDRHDLIGVKEMLEQAGHIVISQWLYEVAARGTLTPEAEADVATRDIQDIDACDTFIIFGDHYRRGQGGRNVELGYAIGTSKVIIAVGFRENPFWWHSSVTFVKSIDEVLELI